MPRQPRHPSLVSRTHRSVSARTIEAPPVSRVELDGVHHPRTLAWWDVIWDSPLVSEWVDADVPGLVALAALWDHYWTAPDLPTMTKAHAELRMSSAQYGLSPMSRRTLQWETRRVEAATTPPAPTRRGDPRLRALK